MSSIVKVGKSGRNAGWWRVRDAIADGQAFSNSTGSFAGRPGPASGTGRLPREYIESARKASYVVYSYNTPIAWRTEGNWAVPWISYSVTTSSHQSIARTATANI